jgi:hypothetical protein
MTTILADANLGVIASDSFATDGDRAWPSVRKVYRVNGCLIACSGDTDEAESFRKSFRQSFHINGKQIKFSHSCALVLSTSGLFHYDHGLIAQKVPNGIESIGTGAKVALAVHDALERKNIKRAVALACKYSDGSRTPVRVYKL